MDHIQNKFRKSGVKNKKKKDQEMQQVSKYKLLPNYLLSTVEIYQTSIQTTPNHMFLSPIYPFKRSLQGKMKHTEG